MKQEFIKLLEVASDILERANFPYNDEWDSIESNTERIIFITKSLEPNEI